MFEKHLVAGVEFYEEDRSKGVPNGLLNAMAEELDKLEENRVCCFTFQTTYNNILDGVYRYWRICRSQDEYFIEKYGLPGDDVLCTETITEEEKDIFKLTKAMLRCGLEHDIVGDDKPFHMMLAFENGMVLWLRRIASFEKFSAKFIVLPIEEGPNINQAKTTHGSVVVIVFKERG